MQKALANMKGGTVDQGGLIVRYGKIRHRTKKRQTTINCGRSNRHVEEERLNEPKEKEPLLVRNGNSDHNTDARRRYGLYEKVSGVLAVRLMDLQELC